MKKANNHVKEIPTISFCYPDENCHLQVKFYDAKQEDTFFSTSDKLCDIADNVSLCTPLKHWKTIGFRYASNSVLYDVKNVLLF